MEEEDEEAGAEPEPEHAVSPERLPQQAHGPGEERDVEQEAGGAELGEHRERCRVRRVLRSAPPRLELLLCSERLATDAHAGDRVIGDDVARHRYEPRPPTRRPADAVLCNL